MSLTMQPERVRELLRRARDINAEPDERCFICQRRRATVLIGDPQRPGMALHYCVRCAGDRRGFRPAERA